MATEPPDEHCLPDVPGLVEHIFPDQILIKPLAEILQSLSAGPKPVFTKDGTWIGLSSKDSQGQKLAKYLNDVAKRIASAANLKLRRTWTAHKKTKGKEKAAQARGLMVVPTGANPRDSWATAISHWSLNSKAGRKAIHASAADAARAIFEAQDTRRFAVLVSILGTRVVLHVSDRAGIVSSQAFDMLKDPRRFLRVLVAMMFSDERYLGYDPTIRVNPDGTRSVTVDDKEYQITRLLYCSASLHGRGTTTWEARRGGDVFAIKDYWADTSRPYTEAMMLEQAAEAGITGISQLVASEIVKCDGEDDHTKLRRPEIGNLGKYKWKGVYEKLGDRVHVRLVLTYAVPITHFRTKKELAGALIDIVQTHTELVGAGILHRDISIHNIMLAPTPTDENGVLRRKGILIDFDYATIYPEDPELVPAEMQRTGTTPFMAINLLESGHRKRHMPGWDIESLFWVLMWICISHSGPENRTRNPPFDGEDLLDSWAYGEYHTVSSRKWFHISRRPTFARVLSTFVPYFKDFEPLVRDWGAKICELIDKEFTPDDVLPILQRFYDSLSAEEDFQESSERRWVEPIKVPNINGKSCKQCRGTVSSENDSTSFVSPVSNGGQGSCSRGGGNPDPDPPAPAGRPAFKSRKRMKRKP